MVYNPEIQAANFTTEEVSLLEVTELMTKRGEHAKYVGKAMLYGIAMSLKVEKFRKNGLRRKN